MRLMMLGTLSLLLLCAASQLASADAKSAQDNAKPNVTGAWLFQVATPNGIGSPTFNFKQEGEKLTGQYKGAFGEAPVTGTVKDNKIEFTLKVEVQGQTLTLTYTGTIEKDGTMKGTVAMGDVGSGTWTGKRQ